MEISNKSLKRRIIEISYKKKLSHIGSCLTAVDIIKEIYDTKKADELFLLSSGHAGLALYAVIEANGGRNAEEIFEHHGVHPDHCVDCGLVVSAGSLGHGLGISVGMALADKEKNVYCLISDGECSEGSVHEALRIKDEQKLDNLIIYVNFNKVGAYKEIHDLYLSSTGLEKIIIRRTGYALEPFRFLNWKLQDFHYKQLTEVNYQEALKMLK